MGLSMYYACRDAKFCVSTMCFSAFLPVRIPVGTAAVPRVATAVPIAVAVPAGVVTMAA